MDYLFVSGIVFTGLIERFGPGLCGFVGAIVASAGLIASSFATDIWEVVVGIGFFTGNMLANHFR